MGFLAILFGVLTYSVQSDQGLFAFLFLICAGLWVRKKIKEPESASSPGRSESSGQNTRNNYNKINTNNTHIDSYKMEVEKSLRNTPQQQQTWYYEHIDELIKHCYNRYTGEFDWKYYFDESDAYFCCPHLWVKEHLISELRDVGNHQVILIRVALENYKHNLPALKERINKMENNVILNLESMFDGGREGKCPSSVKQLREGLYNIVYNRVPLTDSYVNQLIDLTRQIA